MGCGFHKVVCLSALLTGQEKPSGEQNGKTTTITAAVNAYYNADGVFDFYSQVRAADFRGCSQLKKYPLCFQPSIIIYVFNSRAIEACIVTTDCKVAMC